MTKPTNLEQQLYLSLKATPCRCEYERNSRGVPTWHPKEGGGIERKLIKKCSKHVAEEEYEAKYGVINGD
jgi:hypothetical protein